MLNHNHEDQSGGAAYMKEKSGAQVMAGFAEIPYMEHGMFNPPAIPAPPAAGAGGGRGGPRRYPGVHVSQPSGTITERMAKLKTDNKLFVNREIFNEFSAAREVEIQEKLHTLRASNP